MGLRRDSREGPIGDSEFVSIMGLLEGFAALWGLGSLGPWEGMAAGGLLHSDFGDVPE